MAGLTDNGLVIKRLPDILEELEDSLRAYLGNDIDLSENSLLGALNTIYAASTADEWELAQAIYDAFNIDTASGKQLDDLVALLKITRLQPTASSGTLDLFGLENTVVPVGTLFSDTQGNVYQNTTEGTLSTGTSRTPVNISGHGGSGTTGDPSTTYQLTVNGDLYSYQTIWPENDPTFIANKLAALVPTSGLDYVVESISDNNPEFISEIIQFFDTALGFNRNSSTFLNVINLDETNPITVSVNIVNSSTPSHESFNTPFMGVGTKVTTFIDSVSVVAQNTGRIVTPANTLTAIDTPVSGLNSVTNPSQMVVGRALETDEELKQRFKESSAINGNATVPSIEAKLNQVDGVSKAFVVENRTLQTDIKGRSGKSYECVVVGGDDIDIANTIWESKPAGIETFGNVSVQITDSQGRFQTVNFSRSTSIFVWVKAYYTKYSEELFPTNGETLMSTAILNYGDSLDLGEDVIATRFYGSIYSATAGIESLRVLTATSLDPNVEPNISEFTTATISIEDDEISNFIAARIEIIEE